jgi:crossover junction endonuclease MUS81
LEEAVLDLIIERKTEDDLLHSIVDGRFIEQKYRINSSGIVNRIYLLERMENVDFSGIGENKFRAAVMHTQILDNLFLRYTASLEESIKFIIALHNDLTQKYATRPIHLASVPDIASVRRASLLTAIHRQSQLDSCRYLISYACYSAINSKSGTLTLQELFMRQLMTIKQMSADRAACIAERFPTPLSLYQMFSALPDDETRREYFKEWAAEGYTKKFGPVLSQRIFETFWTPAA